MTTKLTIKRDNSDHAVVVCAGNNQPILLSSGGGGDEYVYPGRVVFISENVDGGWLSQESLLKHFAPGTSALAESVATPFLLMAQHIVGTIPDSPEREVTLRKLLESRDAALRAAVR